MSTDSPNAFDTPPQPPAKQGMSTGAKVLIILAVVFGGFLLVCCGGMAFFAYSATKSLNISQDPAEVAKVTAEIAEIDIPAGLDPKMSMGGTIPLVGVSMHMAIYSDKDTGSMLTLFTMQTPQGQTSQEQLRQQMEQSLQQQGGNREVEAEKINVEETREIELTINDKPASFTLSKGTGAKSGKPRIEVVGTFEGKAGATFVMLNVDAEKYPEEKVVETLESIK